MSLSAILLEDEAVDASVAEYIDAIPASHRALFDRVYDLIVAACPDADLVLSYRMPTFVMGSRKLFVGVWDHGVSMYGWRGGGDGGFTDRHPEVLSGKGTIRLRDSDVISDEELSSLVRAVLLD